LAHGAEGVSQEVFSVQCASVQLGEAGVGYFFIGGNVKVLTTKQLCGAAQKEKNMDGNARIMTAVIIVPAIISFPKVTACLPLE
jgi:hypothetical protein